MAEATTSIVWYGNGSLDGMLVSVGELRPHPKNPRRGVVEEIVKSLRRFGQQRPLLALPDGTLVAGHHVWRAALALDWSHVATVRSDLTASEVEAYLLADNRLADLGLYDDAELAALLLPLQQADRLEGIGYTGDDVDSLLAYLNVGALEIVAPRFATPNGQTLDGATVFRILLSFDKERYERMVAQLDAIAERLGLETYSEVVESVVAAAA
jgi:hypothetical protein